MMEGFEALCVKSLLTHGWEKRRHSVSSCVLHYQQGRKRMALSIVGCGDSALSDTGSEGKSCLVATRQGVGEQDPHMAFSDMMKEEDLVATVWG